MRIALVTDSYYTRYAQEKDVAAHVSILAEGLFYIGHDVMVILPEAGRSETEADGNVLKCSGRRAANMDGVQMTKSGSQQMEEKLNAFHPDIVHIHTLSESGAFGLQYADDHDITSLLTIHSLWDTEKSGHTFSPVALLRERTRIDVAEFVLKHANHLAVLTESMAQRLEDDGPREADLIFPFAVDTRFYNIGASSPLHKRALREALSLEDKKIVVCGDCRDTRTLLRFLDSWKKVFMQDDSFYLFVLNRKSQTKALLSHIHSLRLSNRVALIGEYQPDDIASCFALSCCYVSCSHSEELSLSAPEAAACGTPLLIPSGSGTSIVVQEGQNGFCWTKEEDLFALIHKFSRVSGAGKNALTNLVTGSIRPFTPYNQAYAAEAVYLSLLN